MWAELLVERLAADHPRRPTLLGFTAWRALRRGDIAAARRLAAEAVAHAGDGPAAIAALDVLADAGLFDGHLAESVDAALALSDMARRHGDHLYLAIAHSSLALAASYGGRANSDTAAELSALDELPLPPSGRGWVSYTRGELCQGREPHHALAHFDAALTTARAVDNRYLEGAAIVSSCSLRARVGDPHEALDIFGEAVRHWLHVANTTQQVTTLRNLAVLLQRFDAPQELADLLGTVDRSDVPTYGDEAERLSVARGWALTRLGTPRFAELTAAGASRDITAAANLALRVIDSLAQSRRSAPASPPSNTNRH